MVDVNLKENLDNRICDCENDANNTFTYREFIRFTEKDFGLQEIDLDNMNEEELQQYLEFLDELYDK